MRRNGAKLEIYEVCMQQEATKEDLTLIYLKLNLDRTTPMKTSLKRQLLRVLKIKLNRKENSHFFFPANFVLNKQCHAFGVKSILGEGTLKLHERKEGNITC